MKFPVAMHMVSLGLYTATSTVTLLTFFFWDVSVIPHEVAGVIRQMVRPAAYMLLVSVLQRTLTEPKFVPVDASIQFGGIFLGALSIVCAGAMLAEFIGVPLNLPPGLTVFTVYWSTAFMMFILVLVCMVPLHVIHLFVRNSNERSR